MKNVEMVGGLLVDNENIELCKLYNGPVSIGWR